MNSRRHFVKNGLILCLGVGGVLVEGSALSFPRADGKRWGMIIDSSRCSGCQSCMVACKLQNDTVPGRFNTTVTAKETFFYSRAGVRFEAGLCRHCADAPCVAACPTGAAFVHDSGLVMTDWNRCDGNGACLQACPHDARFHDVRFDQRTDKCDLCLHRIVEGLVPACVENCSTGARIFGRLDKPEGEFARYLDAIPVGLKKSRAVHIIATPGKGGRP